MKGCPGTSRTAQKGCPDAGPGRRFFSTAVKCRMELEASVTSSTVEKCVTLGETVRPKVIIKWILYPPPWQHIMRKGRGSRNGCQFSCDTGLTAGDEYFKLVRRYLSRMRPSQD